MTKWPKSFTYIRNPNTNLTIKNSILSVPSLHDFIYKNIKTSVTMKFFQLPNIVKTHCMPRACILFTNKAVSSRFDSHSGCGFSVCNSRVVSKRSSPSKI